MDDREQARLAETVEAAWMWSLAAHGDAAQDIGLSCLRVGGGVVWALRDDPTGGFFCRAVGQGIREPLTDAVLDELVEVATAAGAPCVVLQPSPYAVGNGVARLLAEHGFSAGRTWEKLVRDTSPPPAAETDLRVEAIGPELAEEYAVVSRAGFGMPDLLQPLVVAEVSTPGWTAYGAFDGDRLVGAAALFVDGASGALSGAATLESHRGRGAQRALMARRIEDAARVGVLTLGTETGSETVDAPNPSLHNMHWAGFRRLYSRQNWVRTLP